MPVSETRFDFTGGVNALNSPDTLDRTELVEALNCRLSRQVGGVQKRAGTQRIHDSAIGGGASVLGITQWDAAGQAGQVVAVCNGSLFYKNTDQTDFVQVYGPSPDALTDAFDFSAGSDWSGTGDFTITTATSYFSGKTAYSYENKGTAALLGLTQAVGTLSSGPETFAVVVGEDDQTLTAFGIYDQTADGWVALAEWTRSTGAIVLGSNPEGTNESVAATELEDGTWLLTVTATPSNPGNNRVLYIYPTGFTQNTETSVLHGTFFQVGATNGLSTTARPSFAPFLSSGTNALYIGDGAALWKWDGAELSEITSGSPPDPERLHVHKSRMFATDGGPNIYWSSVNDAEDWSSVEPSTGGSDPVEDYDSEGLVAIEPVGASLLLFKPDNIARFTGTTPATIQIAEQTSGISADVGAIAPLTVTRFGSYVFFLSDRGPYIASEAGTQEFGPLIEPELDDWDEDERVNAVAVLNKRRREIWLFGPSDGETENDEGWIYDTRSNAWIGPWSFTGFNVCSACRYERSDGTESVLLGGYDGRIREGDVEAVGAKDDVLRAGTGGTNVTKRIELPTLFLGDMRRFKVMKYNQSLALDLGAGGEIHVTTSGPDCPTATSKIATKGDGRRVYGFRAPWRGFDLTLVLEESTPEITTLYGVHLSGEYSNRRVA